MERGFLFFGGVTLLSSSGRDPSWQRGTQTSSGALPGTHPFLSAAITGSRSHIMSQSEETVCLKTSHTRKAKKKKK